LRPNPPQKPLRFQAGSEAGDAQPGVGLRAFRTTPYRSIKRPGSAVNAPGPAIKETPLTTAKPYTGYDHLDIWRFKLAEPSFVYVVRASHDDPVKIGVARNVLTRVAELQCGNPRRLHPIYVIPGDRALEQGLHRHLSSARMMGEWFGGPKLEAFISAVADLAERMIAGHDETRELPDACLLAKELGIFGERYPLAGGRRKAA
jgi:hypothetical protein